MSTRTELKDFLIGSSSTAPRQILSSVFPVLEEDVYFNSETRAVRSSSEIYLKWENQPAGNRDTGREVGHRIIIELYSAVSEPYEEDLLSGDLEAAAKILLETYDGDNGRELFRSVISKNVHIASLQEVTSVIKSNTNDEDIHYHSASQSFVLEVVTWEQ